MRSERLYVTERHNIIGAHANRSKMAAFIVDNFRRVQSIERPWQFVGVWVLVPLTGQYQRTLTLGEWTDSWDGFERMVGTLMIEPPVDMGGVYREIDELRLGGECVVMEPGPGCPSLADLMERNVKGSLLSYERAEVTPGTEAAYLDAVATEWAPIAENYGYSMIGNYVAAKVDGVVFTAWACERAGHTGLARSTEARAWRDRRRELSLGWREELWVAAAGSPLAGAETVAAH
jgi:hypothetical protein